MGIESFIKSIIQAGFVSEEDTLYALAEQFKEICLNDYDTFVSVVKKNHIEDETFFQYIYMNASEDVKYQMWKDGYVDSCPAGKLLEDIASEDLDVIKLIKQDYEKNLLHCEAFFDGIQDVIIGHISKAKESLKIAMAWFTNPIIFNSLLRVCKRGIEVNLLINNDLINNRPNGLPFNKLINAGAYLYIAEFPKLIHNKFCIIDDKIVIDGSYNWTILAEKNNDENIVVMKNGKVIESFIDAFDSLINNYEQVDEMPNRIPERPEYDILSYRNFNSEEWLEQVEEVISGKKKREIYKEVFKNLPEEVAIDKIPQDIFDSVKEEVEEERNRDTNLFNQSIVQKTEELQKDLSVIEEEKEKLVKEIERKKRKRIRLVDKYKKSLKSIESKKTPKEQRDAQLSELRKAHRSELKKLDRIISRQQSEIDNLLIESEVIGGQQSLISSLQNADLQGSNGLCRINLKWNTADDLDLHLLLPLRSIDGDGDIYYSNMSKKYKGGLCSLDYDAIPKGPGENPQENIVWENKLPDGKYRIKVKLYNKVSDSCTIPFSITVFTSKYVKTEVFDFRDATSGDIIDIVTLTFKNGKVVTPIKFKKESK